MAQNYKISDTDDLFYNLPYKIQNNFFTLLQINQVLSQLVPEHLIEYCHFGAIDNDKNHIILFILNNELHHILKNYSEHILQGLQKHGFMFDGLIIKVKQYIPTNITLNTKHNDIFNNTNNIKQTAQHQFKINNQNERTILLEYMASLL